MKTATTRSLHTTNLRTPKFRKGKLRRCPKLENSEIGILEVEFRRFQFRSSEIGDSSVKLLIDLAVSLPISIIRAVRSVGRGFVLKVVDHTSTSHRGQRRGV